MIKNNSTKSPMINIKIIIIRDKNNFALKNVALIRKLYLGFFIIFLILIISKMFKFNTFVDFLHPKSQ